MTQPSPHFLINKLDDCEERLLKIVDKFGKLAQAAIGMYQTSNDFLPRTEEEIIQEENQMAIEKERLDLNKETEEIANQIKTFGTDLTDVLRDLPNDEPIKPNFCDFDSFLLDYTEKSIMKKIQDIGNAITNKKPTLTSRRSY